jgi:hypothetical protein
MKNILTACTFLLVLLSACEKKTTPIDVSYATVTLDNLGKNYVTDDIAVNPKDSLYFSFTIAATKPMKYVSIQKNPTNQTAFLVRDTLKPGVDKFSYSAVKKLMADSANGSYLYRIVAHDSSGNYIGSRDINVFVNPDFKYYTVRVLSVPDTTGKSNKCYYSIADSTTYSYTDGASKSARIDFGYFYDTTSIPTANPPKHTIYALNAPNIFAPYDISTWTKNATTFRLAPSSTNFQTTLTSAGAIKTAWNSGTATAVASKFSTSDRPSSSRTNLTGAIIMFKTAAGRIGALLINYTKDNKANADSYVNVDVKIAN